MLSRVARRGFTLIEVLVGITLVALLMALGVPAMRTFNQNNKIRSAAADYYSGLQTARAEAIRSNLPVEFVLTNATGAAAAPSIAGRNWVVRAIPPAPALAVLIDQKTGLEGEGNTTQSIAVNVAVSPVGFDGRIIFNGFGTPSAVPPNPVGPYSIDITNPALGFCVPVGPARCKRINVTAGGQITACDPAVAAATGDTRAC